MLDLVKIGEKIKECRQRKGYSQEQLAETLFVSRQAVSRWEQGLAMPTIDNLCELIGLFDVSFDSLLCLNLPPTFDKTDIFSGHSRQYVVNEICRGRLQIDLSEEFYRFSSDERMQILVALKTNVPSSPPITKNYNENNFWRKLTDYEKQFFNMNKFKEELKNEIHTNTYFHEG